MSKKKYTSKAEKQRAWRIRHGQKRKIPTLKKERERLGASESELRAKKEGETWSEYHTYLLSSVSSARKRQEKAGGVQSLNIETSDNYEESTGARRGVGKTTEPEIEELDEIRLAYEAGYKEGKMEKKKK